MNKNCLCIASFAFLLFVGQVSSQDHLWAFDEGTGTTSADSGTSRNRVNAILNNAQWRDLSKVGPGAAVHLTGDDNSYVSFGNGRSGNTRGGDSNNDGRNNFPNNDDSDDENNDNNSRNNFLNNDDNNDGNNFHHHHHHDDNNDEESFPNNDDNNRGNNFSNSDDDDDSDDSDGDNFPNSDDDDSDGDNDNNRNHNNGNNIGQFGIQDFTVAFWFQTNDYSVPLADLIGNRAASGHGNFFAVRLSSDGYVSAEVDQDAAGTNYIGIRSSQNRLNDGNWHQVVVVRSGRTLTLYIDGVYSNSGTSNGVANINNGVVFKLGRSLVDRNTPRFAIDGVFDDVAIYNSAISAYQVKALDQGATNQ